MYSANVPYSPNLLSDLRQKYVLNIASMAGLPCSRNLSFSLASTDSQKNSRKLTNGTDKNCNIIMIAVISASIVTLIGDIRYFKSST
ncbi:MAG TPA: hypothetical protein VLD84_02605 [Nitrososphaeraceae archaeon]|nr:hypothetical protein [Nitrososphaeraceae archaeon]